MRLFVCFPFLSSHFVSSRTLGGKHLTRAIGLVLHLIRSSSSSSSQPPVTWVLIAASPLHLRTVGPKLGAQQIILVQAEPREGTPFPAIDFSLKLPIRLNCGAFCVWTHLVQCASASVSSARAAEGIKAALNLSRSTRGLTFPQNSSRHTLPFERLHCPLSFRGHFLVQKWSSGPAADGGHHRKAAAHGLLVGRRLLARCSIHKEKVSHRRSLGL